MFKPAAEDMDKIRERLKELDQERWQRIGGTPEPFPSRKKKESEEEPQQPEPSLYMEYD